jgi:hypothetical protein
MADCRITCIEKSHPNGGYGHITHAGNPPTWVWRVEDIIASIDAKTNTFYVQDAQGRRAYVGVRRPAGGRAYIQTYADGVWTDNLLALDTCVI